YGVADGFELGYLRSKKTNVFSGAYQFMGPRGTVGSVYPNPSKWYGSAGLQFSWTSYNLPKLFGVLQSQLGYHYKRKDFLLPVTFSYSIGHEEELGSLSFGTTLGYHLIDYGFVPKNVFDNAGNRIQAEDHQNRFFSVGGFCSLKLGYKYVYIIPSFSFYYQNYGTYPLLNNAQISMKGFTFIPAISLQFNTAIRK